MMNWKLGFLALLTGCIGFASNAFAVTVDIDSRTNNENNAIELSLDAGTYQVALIGTIDGGSFDAWSAWAVSTCTDPLGCINTRPTSVTGFLTGYTVLSPNLSSVMVDGIPLPIVSVRPAVKGSFFLVAAGEETQYRAYDGKVFPDATSALNSGKLDNNSSFTVSAGGIVKFAIFDCNACLGDNRGGISLVVTPVVVGPDRVDIDIKPGSDPNSINLVSSGVVPVAILGSEDFDATTVDPETVRLADAEVKMVGRASKLLCSIEDVDLDGFDDMVCQVVTIDLDLAGGDIEAILRATTFDGTEIEGSDTVNIVKE